MSTTQASPRPRRQRVKTSSSLRGMMALDEKSPVDQASFTQYSDQEREGLKEMTRKLRQAKRKLLLKRVEQPVSSVDKFRELLLGLSVDAMEEDDGSSTNSFRVHSNNSLLTSSGSDF